MVVYVDLAAVLDMYEWTLIDVSSRRRQLPTDDETKHCASPSLGSFQFLAFRLRITGSQTSGDEVAN